MAILYLVPGCMQAAELARRRSLLQQWADGGVAVEAWDSPLGPSSIESEEDEARCIPPLLERIVEAEAAGFQGIIIGCFGDTGLAPARERVTVPVIGPAQASLRKAAAVARRVSILTVVETVVPLIARLVHGYGMDDRVASIRVVETHVLELARDPEETFRRLRHEGGEAVKRDGAEALILGCMSMGFQEGLAERMQQELGARVFNPVRAALDAALKGAGGRGSGVGDRRRRV